MRSVRPPTRTFRRAAAATSVASLMLGIALAVPTTAVAADALTPYDAVNMWIGTAKDPNQNKANDAYGNTFPGATTPFGMVQLSPTTASSTSTEGKNATGNWGGYMWSDTDTFLKGFGMTRLSGTGCNDRLSGFDLPYLPYTGTIDAAGALPTSPGLSGAEMTKYYSQFKHTDEEGSPGYYKVKVDADGQVQSANDGAKNTTVELTATTRTGVSKVGFPATGNAAILFNVSGSNNNNGESKVTINPATRTISGYSTSKTVCNEGSYRIYFSTTFDKPFKTVSQWKGSTTSAPDAQPETTVTSDANVTNSNRSQGADQTGVVLQFEAGSNVELRTGISYVSTENATLNRTTEAPATSSFADLRAAAKTTWTNTLGTINASGGTDKERTKFYSALYHSVLHPNIYDDVNGQYRGYYSDSRNGKTWNTSGPDIKQLKLGQEHEYVTYSSWDSLRGQMQLIATLFPKVGSDMAQSISNMGEQVGTWYNWPHLGSAQKKMEGDGMQVIVASLYAFGSTDFEASAAVDSMVNATSLGKDSYFRANFVQYAGTGFIEDRWTTATSTTMDYAMADFSIAQLAQRVGKSDVHDSYMNRAQSWRNLVSQDTAYPDRIVPRDRKGPWGSFSLNNRSNNSGAPDGGAQNRDQFDQSTGLQYQWYMTQNMSGLIDAQGGKATAESKLDSLFNYPALDRLDVSGSSSQGAYLSNQPSMHTPWVYNWLGKPYKATQVLDKAINSMYYAQAIDTSVPSPANPGFNNSVAIGMPGNDDLGSLSSWYVWANLGIYPAIFGRSEMIVTSPHFDKTVITSKNLDGTAASNGRTMTLNAPGQATNRYINGLTVNGTAQNKTWLPESFTRNGGTLDFAMTTSTGSTWGTSTADAPPSFNEGRDAYNGVGTGVVGTKNAGSLDVGGVTFPRDVLPAPGAEIEFGGLKYTWPNSAPLTPDHWIPNGQTIDMHGIKASELSFLGTATNGPSSGTATVVYSDGTTVNVPVSFPDWTPSSWTDTTVNQSRISATGRLTANGTKDSANWRVYSITPASLNATKNIAKVILPKDVKNGLMHIFTIGTNANQAKAPTVTPTNPAIIGTGTANITGTGVQPGDTIQVTLNTPSPTTASVVADASGAFSASVNVHGGTPAGTYSVTATGPGGYTFTTEVTISYVTAVTAPATVIVGKPVSITGTGFSGGEPVMVTLGDAVAFVAASASGDVSATLAAPLLPGGYTARAMGSISLKPASAPVTVLADVAPVVPTPTVVLNAPAKSVAGKSATLRATLPSTARGNVVFYDGAKILGTVTLKNGIAQLKTTKLGVGNRTVSARYTGSAQFKAATSRIAKVTVSKAAIAKIKVTGKKYQAKKKFSVTVTISAKLNNGKKTAGKVKVYVAKKAVKTVKLSSFKKGKAKVTISAKFAKKKSVKVKAQYVPSSPKTTAAKTSKTLTLKRR